MPTTPIFGRAEKLSLCRSLPYPTSIDAFRNSTRLRSSYKECYSGQCWGAFHWQESLRPFCSCSALDTRTGRRGPRHVNFTLERSCLPQELCLVIGSSIALFCVSSWLRDWKQTATRMKSSVSFNLRDLSRKMSSSMWDWGLPVPGGRKYHCQLHDALATKFPWQHYRLLPR